MLYSKLSEVVYTAWLKLLRGYMPVKHSSLWAVFRVCVAITVLFLLLLQSNTELWDFSKLVPHTQSVELLPDEIATTGFLINTNGCRIPDMDPMDISVRHFMGHDKPLNCAQKYGPVLVESNLTAVFINESVLAYYNVSSASQLRCCYTPFWREEVNASHRLPARVVSQIRFSNLCQDFHHDAVIQNEFIEINCVFGNKTIYRDFYAFTPIAKVEKKTSALLRHDAVSVLILGIDAVSRLNMHRQMPQTVQFLKKNLNVVEYLGYNKVGDNTFPNLVPVLTGLSEDELTNSCWPSTDSVFDDCPFIWKNFSSIGYTTAFAEDASWMGIFNYMKSGFRKQPTDFYFSEYNRHAETQIGFEIRLNARLCVGPRKVVQTLLDYAYKFVRTMKNVFSFGFFWGTSLSHDFLNLPKQGDQEHREFLKNLYNENIFNRTVLILMSDHGIRWGEIRSTYQGYLEERLPFLFIAYPDWFRIKYTTAISNLKRNARRLTTPYDLHEFLNDLTDLNRITREELKRRSIALIDQMPLPRGISLFLPIPTNRVCQDTGIVDHWCTCHESTTVSTNNTNVVMSATYLVTHINSLLTEYSQCANLTLHNITNAREEKSTSHVMFEGDIGITDYTVTVETVPGNAIFESNVRYNGNSNNYSVVGTISRLNLYGSQSQCVPHYRLRLYCYCTH